MKWLSSILFLLSFAGYSRTVVKDSTYFKEKIEYAQSLFKANDDSAITYSDKLITELEEAGGFERYFPGVYMMRGNHYHQQGLYPQALDEYHTTLDYSQNLRDSILIAKSNESIANVHYATGRYKEALEKYMFNLNYWRRIGRTASEGNALRDVHKCLTAMGLHGEALAYGFEAIEVNKKVRNKESLGSSYYSVALSYYSLSVQHPKHKLTYLNSAVFYIREALRLAWSSGTPLQAMEREVLYGYIENGLGDYDKGIEHCMLAKGTPVGKEERQLYTEACNCLADGYQKKGQYTEAYKYFDEYSYLKDSLRKANNMLLITRKELQHEYEREKFADSLQNQMVVHELEAEHSRKASMSKVFILISLVMCGVAFFFSIYVYRDYRDKKQINKQLAMYNKEIMDSIGYAKRIQEAILPPEHFIDSNLPDYFILYKPKDIVAGDFYWMEKQGEQIILAAADCTGHGVPGAMVSVICYNALNRAVREFGLTDPGRILDKVRELVVETFQTNFDVNSEIRDGMDISLCTFDPSRRQLAYAGANNPLWVLRDGSKEMEVYKANREPIGKIDNPTPFETQHIQLHEGDLVYLFTDGYADQFGGDKGKKFRYKPFRDLLSELSKESLAKQREHIDEVFETWKGELEQIDDVCVIAVRV